MSKAYKDDQSNKNVLQSSDSTKKQKTLGFMFRRQYTTMSDATSSNASSSNATSMRSTGTSSSSTSTIFTVGGKENNIRSCSDEENTSASSGGRDNATSSNAESDDSGRRTSNDTDEEDEREPAAGLRPSESGFWTNTAGALPTFGRRTSNEVREPPATYSSGRPSSSTASHRTTPRTQSLLSPPATPVMKDRLDPGDLPPADEVQIENALTKASAVMKLATLPDKDCVYLYTAYGWILNIIQFTERTKQEVKNVVMPITNACGDSMVTIGQAYVDGRFRRAEDIDDTYGPHTHRFGESMKCPIMVIGNAGVCAQVEQYIVELQGDRATNQRWEGIKANGKDTYGRVISRTKPGYIYYNRCHDYIRNQEQYLIAKKNKEMKLTATRVWTKFRKYGLRRYIKRVTAVPNPNHNPNPDVVDEEESTEAAAYETMMAELDTAVEIVLDTLPIIDSSNDDVILDTLSDNLRPEIVDIIMEHPDGGMLDDAMGSLCRNWTATGSAQYSGLIRERRSRLRGIITSITGEPLAAFKKLGRNLQCGQDSLRYLVGGRNFPTAVQIKEAGVDGHPIANGLLRVRECFPADLSNFSSFHDMMMAWRNDAAKAQALRTAKELSASAGNLRRGGNNGSIIVSCAATFTDAVRVASGDFERTFDSLRRFNELLHGPLKEFHIAGGCNAKQMKLRLEDPNDRCEFDSKLSRQGVKKLYPAFRLRYANEE